MMGLRRLDPEKDEALYRETFAWDERAPRWFRESDAVFRPDSVEDYLKQAKAEDQIDIGVFDEELVGLITVTRRGSGLYEGHLSAKRGASVELLTEAAKVVKEQMFDECVKVGFVWVAKINRHVLRLCRKTGFREDGVSMFRGSTHGKAIEWLRLSCERKAA